MTGRARLSEREQAVRSSSPLPRAVLLAPFCCFLFLYINFERKINPGQWRRPNHGADILNQSSLLSKLTMKLPKKV